MTPLIVLNAALALLIAAVVVSLLSSAIRRSNPDRPLDTEAHARRARQPRPLTGPVRRPAARAMRSQTF